MNEILKKENKYISNDIRNYILKCKKVYEYNNKNFKITFYSKNFTKKKNEKLLEVIERIKTLYKEYKIKYLEFYIFDYNGNRYLSKYMKSHYINGGFTYINSNVIYIYRYKEYPKVIIHEIYHHIYHPIQQYCSDYELYEKYGKNIMVYEAITEYLATIRHLKFISKGNFEKLLKDEIKYARNLSKYILSIKKDDTNIKSYIFLKYILLKNHNIIDIHKPCEIYKILLYEDISSIKKKEIKGRMNMCFMLYSNL